MGVSPLQRLIGLLIVLLSLAVGFSYTPERPVQTLVARWAPPPSDFLDIDGQLVHLRDEGPRADPLPIVLVHGTASSLHTWDGWAKELARTRRVIRFDLPGFGLTGPSVRNDYSRDADARFTLQLLDRLGVGRFVIGGNSLGGEVAWRTALLAPARVDRVVLVDAAGYPFEPQEIPLAFRLARLPGAAWLSSLSPRGLTEASVKSVYARPERVTPELVDRYRELTLREGNRRALIERVRQFDAARGRDVEGLKSLPMPVLILWGREDRLIPPDNGERFQRDIPRSTLVVLDDLGHVPQEEDPRRSVQPVLSFLGMR